MLNDGFDVVAGDHARIRDHFTFAVGFQRADFQVDETAHAGIEQTDRKARRINATGTDQCGKVNHAAAGRRRYAQPLNARGLPAQLLDCAQIAAKYGALAGIGRDLNRHINVFARAIRIEHPFVAYFVLRAAQVIKAQFNAKLARKRVFSLDNPRFDQHLLLRIPLPLHPIVGHISRIGVGNEFIATHINRTAELLRAQIFRTHNHVQGLLPAGLLQIQCDRAADRFIGHNIHARRFTKQLQQGAHGDVLKGKIHAFFIGLRGIGTRCHTRRHIHRQTVHSLRLRAKRR